MTGSKRTSERIRLNRKLLKIRMCIMDIDGVLTNGGIILGSNAQEFKIFDVQDGMGITLARKGGLKVGIITGRKSEAVSLRASELHYDALYQGYPDKLEAYKDILGSYVLENDAICYIGDDLLDIPLMQRAGLAVAVANAREEVKKAADYIFEYLKRKEEEKKKSIKKISKVKKTTIKRMKIKFARKENLRRIKL